MSVCRTTEAAHAYRLIIKALHLSQAQTWPQSVPVLCILRVYLHYKG